MLAPATAFLLPGTETAQDREVLQGILPKQAQDLHEECFSNLVRGNMLPNAEEDSVLELWNPIMVP